MPTISHFGGIAIHLYYNDHDPPHFHVNYSGLLTRIEIDTGEYVNDDSPLPRGKEKEVLKWLDIHKDDMMKAWNDCRHNQVPDKIPPL
ncbi:DUF4160 domain-containing protein [Pontibacillus sp. ALD_SL1]|uniref:DUF4160 domain-containing protein n=1 Tax=Pontibacillus sp. ALD_SL1 TaxID=2777185 RepID=UPI001A97B177|nr:DUF4160 domain-containing protein [Pontibacillus sp. ALD_SL1]QSS99757.1 DUF4160 domain-containing protein [Pontibacillus sp. ALD_SL1]